MSRYFVYSTLTNDQAYTNWTVAKVLGQRSNIQRDADNNLEQVLIKGGANLSTEHFATPLGVRTEISEKQYAVLQRNKQFLDHIESRHIIVKTEADDPELIARKYMQAKDESAPYTPRSEIFQDKGEDTITPVVGATLKGKVVSAIRGVFQ